MITFLNLDLRSYRQLLSLFLGTPQCQLYLLPSWTLNRKFILNLIGGAASCKQTNKKSILIHIILFTFLDVHQMNLN